MFDYQLEYFTYKPTHPSVHCTGYFCLIFSSMCAVGFYTSDSNSLQLMYSSHRRLGKLPYHNSPKTRRLGPQIRVHQPGANEQMSAQSAHRNHFTRWNSRIHRTQKRRSTRDTRCQHTGHKIHWIRIAAAFVSRVLLRLSRRRYLHKKTVGD